MKGEPYMISYAPLCKTMKEKNISQYRLIKDFGMSRGQLARLKKNENITTYTLNQLCRILNCGIEDVVVYISDE